MSIRAAAIAACLSGAAAASPCAAADALFDGNWSVVLVCPDTTDANGPVKGYEFTFPVTVREGVVQGSYGAPGHPSSLTYAGKVSSDGTLAISATGYTGPSEYSVGKLARGTRYTYTMQGRLEGQGGRATRKEGRPCAATFTRS